MKRITGFALVVWTLLYASAWAEFMEIQAAEIASIKQSELSTESRVLVKWDLPTELSNKIIDGAVIEMKVGVEGEAPVSISVMPLNTRWSATTANWTSGWRKPGGDFSDTLAAPSSVDDRNGGKIVADVFDIVLKQIAGARQNFGFIIVTEAGSETKLKSITANDVTKRASAKLIIAYREQG